MSTLHPHATEGNTPLKNRRTGPAPRPLAERFWEKVNRGSSNECWEWKACTYQNGYGKFSRTRCNSVYAHRTAYELVNGPIPDELLVCHSCDNRRCCNPDHLFLGTQKVNMQDCKQKGRNSLPPRPLAKEKTWLWLQAPTLHALYKTGKYRQIDLAEMFHTTQSTISLILRSTCDDGVV